MSLKFFHILFITLSIILAFGFGAWAIRFHQAHTNVGYLSLGVLSLFVGVGLILYEIKVIKKFKKV